MKKYMLVFLMLVFIWNLGSMHAEAISAASYCVIETTTGKVLYAKNADVRRGMASTTKIMTALVALESGKATEIATVSANASRTEGSSLYLKPGEKMLVRDLVYGLMLNSGNDAAVVLAEHIGGSVEGFVALMNTKAQEIGASNTHFVNPNGLSDDAHYTTARDLAVITAHALQNQDFREIVSTKQMVIETVENPRKIYLSNHNKLLNRIEGCDGVKTGFTKATGRCLVSSVTNNGFQTVCVTLNASDDWNDHTQLHNLAFSEYEVKTLVENGTLAGTASVYGGAEPQVNGVIAETVTGVYKMDLPVQTDIQCTFEQNLNAPIERGQKIGTAELYVDGREIAQVDIVAARSVPALRVITFKNIFESLFRQVFQI